MNILKKIDAYVSLFTEWLLSASILLMAIVLVSNVIARKVFSHSIPAADEIGVTLIILATFSGIGYAAKKGRHIRMSALFDAVPKKVQKVLIILISVVTAITYVYVCYIAIELYRVHENARQGDLGTGDARMDTGCNRPCRICTGSYPVSAEHSHQHTVSGSIYRNRKTGDGGIIW